MSIAIICATVLALILLAAALMVVWSRRDAPVLRGLAIPLAVIATMGGGGSVLLTLGHAVPLIGGITAPSGDLTMLSAKLVPSNGIYLTLDLPGAPRLYWLPWDQETAEEIQEMLSNPENGAIVATVPPFEWSWDISEPQFQPLPQPKFLPDKPESQEPTAPHFSA